MIKNLSYVAVVFSMIFIPDISYACKCDTSKLRKFIIDPSSAPVALVGILNESKYRIFLKV